MGGSPVCGKPKVPDGNDPDSNATSRKSDLIWIALAGAGVGLLILVIARIRRAAVLRRRTPQQLHNDSVELSTHGEESRAALGACSFEGGCTNKSTTTCHCEMSFCMLHALPAAHGCTASVPVNSLPTGTVLSIRPAVGAATGTASYSNDTPTAVAVPVLNPIT